MKKLLYLMAFVTGTSYGAFRSDYITATSSATAPVVAITTANATYIYNTSSTITNLSVTNLSVTSATIPSKVLGTPTYSTINDFMDSFGSTGRKTGGVMTDAGSSKINVSAGTGFIKATDDDNANLMFFNFPSSSSIPIPAGSVRYIGVEYNSGSPRVVARTSWNWNLDSEFSLGRVINETINGAEGLHIINNPWWVTDGITNVIERFRGFGRVKRDENVGGLALSVTGTRNIAVTAGTLWSNLNEHSISAIDTSVSGTVELYWYKAGEGWQEFDSSTYSVTQYNDVTQTSLQSLGVAKYANVWVYAEADDVEIAVLFPQAEYNTAAAAEAVGSPANVPVHIANNGILIGRIIIKQGTDTPIAVESAFGTAFTASVVTNHANLSNLNWASAGHTIDQDLALGNYGLTGSSVTAPYVGTSSIATVSKITWADGTVQVSSPVAGGSSSVAGVSTQTIFLAASGLLSLEASFAPLVTISTGVFYTNAAKFDDTTRQFKNFSFVPASNSLTTSTVTFSITTTYATSAAGKYIGWDLDYYCPAAASNWGTVTLSTTSVAFPLDANAWGVTISTWTASWTSLGWTGGRACKARISRKPDVANDVTGDVYLHDLKMEIPTKVE